MSVLAQIGLPLDWPADDEAFIVGPSNQAAVHHLDSHARWPVKATILTGPRKSGRSVLGRIFARRTGGRLIDDAEGKDERDIFNAWNDAQDSGRPLLIIADAAPPAWRPALADLRSRLAATPVVSIGDPDEQVVGGLIARLLERRGLAAAPEVVSYLVPRVERRHRSVIALADALDAAALAGKRPVTVPLARDVLGAT